MTSDSSTEIRPRMNTDSHGSFKQDLSRFRIRRAFFLSAFICAHLWLISSCSSKPTDVRTVVPADALVYLETQDLGKVLHAVTDNDAFRNAAKTQPDLSALNGIRMAVAVTGFETKEEKVTDENAVLNFQPRFVAVAETNAWNYQAIAFTENKLGEFINEIYGGEIELESSPKYDGRYFVWTARDGRKAYALVTGSLIFFGNDESAIEKCIAVRKGEAEPISKNPKLPAPDLLASGYVAPDGVGQLANIATLQLAIGAGEEEEVRGFIARVLPEILRKSVTEVTWTAKKSEQGVEDSYTFATKPEVGKVLSETVRRSGNAAKPAIEFIPEDIVSATRYDLDNPQIAWLSILLTAQSQTDGLSGGIIGAFSGSLFEAYGIEQPEEFLGAIEGNIVTLRFDVEGENVVAIAAAKDIEKLKRSMAKEIKFSSPAEKVEGADVWRSADGELAFAVLGNRILTGDAESVLRCLKAAAAGQNVAFRERFAAAANSPAPAVTVAIDTDPTAAIVGVLATRKDETTPVVQRFQISTSFTGNAIQRVEISDFGLIGSVVEQFAKEQ